MITSVGQRLSTQLNIIKESPLKTKLLLSITIFLISLLPFLIACPEWFFDGEDYFVLYRVSLIKNFKDFIELFLCGQPTINANALGCDLPLEPASTFFSSLYRPLTYAIHLLQYHLFGLNAWADYTCIIFLHAVITSLLFYCLAFFITYPVAFLCSLFFAFHPTLDSWLGKIDLQQHQVHLFFALCTIIAFRKYLDRQNISSYILSCLLFFLCILTRETFIILPFIIFIALRLFPGIHGQKFKSLSSQLKLMIGFCLIIALYTFLRNTANPFTFARTTPQVKMQIWDFFNNLYVILNPYPRSAVWFFEANNMMLFFRSIRLFFAVILVSLFLTNNHKKVVLFFLFCMGLLYWPALMVTYHGYRFLYEPLPFYIAAIASLINFSSLTNYSFVRNIGTMVLVILIFINASFTIMGMQKYVSIRKPTYTTLKKLETNDTSLKTYPILTLDNAESQTIDLGLVHAMQLHGITGSNAQYCIQQFNTHAKECNLSELIVVMGLNNGIRLTSLDNKSVWFTYKKNQSPPFFIKQIIIHDQDPKDNIYDFSIIFEKNYFTLPMIVFLWSEKDDCFVKFYVNKT